MILNGSVPLDQKRAVQMLEHYISKGKLFELKEKKERRTIRQNSYLHLILSWFALEYGETLEHVKQYFFKEIANPDIFYLEYINRKTGECRDTWKSTADLDTKELTVAIDRFRNYAAKEAGIYLPEPKDLALLQEIENTIENNKQWL